MPTIPPPSRPEANPGFERKVRLSTLALFFERAWPRVWAALALAGLFVALSLMGLWPWLSEIMHKLVIASFGVALIGVIALIARTPWPLRDDAIRRLEIAPAGMPLRSSAQ